MSDPDLDPLDSDLAALLDVERSRPAPASDVRARVLARVSATVGPGHGGAPPQPPNGAGLLLKPILMGLALGAAVVAAVAVHEGAGPSPAVTPVPTMPERGAISTPAPTAAAAPPPSAAAPPSTAARPPAEGSAAPARDESLAAERSILDEANHALLSGRSAAAFEALARHAEAFPRGRLSEEREGLWIRALLAAGRNDEARARAARFKRLFPRSMLLPALESTLGTNP